MTDFSLVELEDQYMATKPNYGIHRPGLYPSESSVKYLIDGEEVVDGGCMRASWYRLMNIPSTGGPNVSLQMKGNLGKWGEIGIINRWKEMGIWVDNNVKFFNKELFVSGELDAIIREPGTDKLLGIECCRPDSMIVGKDYIVRTFEDFAKDSCDVLTHTSNFCSVKNIQTKEVKNEIIYSPWGKFSGLGIHLTGEHPVLVAKLGRTEWIKACELKKNDFICIPKAKFTYEKEIIDYKDLQVEWDYQIVNEKVYSRSHNYLQQEKGFPVEIEADADFYWLLGLYLAEGSCSKNTVYFSLHMDELDIINKIKKIVSKYGLDISVTSLDKGGFKSENGKGVNISVVSKPFRELIKFLIPGNTKDRTKRIRYEFINHKYLKDILFGAWLGDGHFANSKQRTNNAYRLSTAVPSLAYLYFQMALWLNFDPGFNRYVQYESTFGAGSLMYTVNWTEKTGLGKGNIQKTIDCGEYWAYKIKRIDRSVYSGIVYNMEIEKDNSYVVGTIATHNCKSFYNFAANKEICGGKQPPRPGRPKMSHFLQSCIYAWDYQHILDEYRIFYFERGDGHRVEFKIGFVEESPDRHLCYWQQIPGQYWSYFLPGKIIQPFSIEDIHARCKELLQYAKTKTIPPRDYPTFWPDEKVEWLYKHNRLNKTSYDAWVKNPSKNKPKSWQCSYCKFQGQCQQDSAE